MNPENLQAPDLPGRIFFSVKKKEVIKKKLRVRENKNAMKCERGRSTMKERKAIVLCMLVLLLAGSQKVMADTGPKPSVVIDFEGLEGENYYATLLSEDSSTGPHSALDSEYGNDARYQEGDEDYDIYRQFVEYEDSDGFYFLQYFGSCADNQQFRWGYYPPQRFKILLYFPERDCFLTNDVVYERYAFDSYFAVNVELREIGEENADMTVEQAEKENIETTVEPTGGMTVKKNTILNAKTYAQEVLALIVRALITIAVEITIAFLFAFRGKKQLRLLIVVNLVTQIALNLVLYLLYYKYVWITLLLFYPALEILVFVVEGAWYAKRLNLDAARQASRAKIWMYALVANAASFGLGLWLSGKIPIMF